jgi:hypothetical protein
MDIKMTRFSPKTILFTSISVSLVLLAGLFSGANAQDTAALDLGMSRTFGFSSGTGQIQGTFTLKARGPENLVRVEFFIDGRKMGEATQAPFNLRFETGDYAYGVHTIEATGFTTDGQELQSNQIRTEFVSAQQGWQTTGKIVLPILGVIVLVAALSFVIPLVTGRGKTSSVPLGAPRNYGALGGAVCPKCGRPFSRHIWGLNVIIGKLDRCPHCGKWSIVQRASPTALRQAEARELEIAQEEGLQPPHESEEEKLRKELENSRYQDY